MKLSQLGVKSDNVWPIGKHKGVSISLLPTDYLMWVVYDSSLQDYLKQKAYSELSNRNEQDLNNLVDDTRDEVLSSLDDYY